MTALEVCECWSRDGLQSWGSVVPTADKVSVVRAAVGAGIGELDATSLVPPKYAPQFADAEAFLEGISDLVDVRARLLAPNLKGVQWATQLAQRHQIITTVGFPISASEAHNLANLKKTHEVHLREIAEMVACAHDAGLEVIVAVATAFGCPIVGDVPEETVFSIAHHLADLGVERLMLSDTTGLADPPRVKAFVERARREMPDVGLVAHFHDTRGTGLLNTWAAVEAGVTCVDSCLGGIGGEPSTVEQNHAGEAGNICTEDFVVLLERAGFDTGIDVDQLIEAGRLAERVLASTGRSQVLRTGHGLGTPPPLVASIP